MRGRSGIWVLSANIARLNGAGAGLVTGGGGGDPDDSAADHQHIRARLRDDPGPAHELGGLVNSELVKPDSRSCGHDPIMSAAVAAP
jgi:hypothetical protein